MTDLNPAVPIILAAAALAATALVRLLKLGLWRMPAPVAAAALSLGVGVAGFGALQLVMPDRLGLTAADDPPAQPLPLETVPPAAQLPSEQPEQRGAVTGSVRLHTGEPVEGAEVVLRHFEGTEQAGSQVAVTGPEGSFEFTGLQTGPRHAYVVSAEHDDTLFRSSLLMPGAHGATSQADLVVAPGMHEPDALRLQVDSTVLIGDEQGVQVLQVLSVHNSLDGHAYVGGIRLPLLPDAFGFEPREGLDRTQLVLDGDDLVSLTPILPGETEIIYTYTIPMPSDGLTVERTVHYPTEQLSLLVADGLRARSESLDRSGDVEIGPSADDGARSYEELDASDLDPGTTVVAEVRIAGPGWLRTAAIGGAVAVAVIVLGYPLVRRRRTAAPAGDPVVEPTEVEA